MIAKQQSQADLPMENAFVAKNLRDVADQLKQQAAVPLRARAYREAAAFVAGLSCPIREIYEKEGRRGLEELPEIGASPSAAIAVLLDSRAWEVLDRLKGQTGSDKLSHFVQGVAANA